MKVNKVDQLADFPQHTYFEQLDESVPSVTEDEWRYCVKHTESLEHDFRAFEFEITTEKLKWYKSSCISQLRAEIY
jgi:hypothetical protein